MSQGLSSPSSTTSCCRLVVFMPLWAIAGDDEIAVAASKVAMTGSG